MAILQELRKLNVRLDAQEKLTVEMIENQEAILDFCRRKWFA